MYFLHLQMEYTTSLSYKLVVATLRGSHMVVGRDVWSRNNRFDHGFSIVRFPSLGGFERHDGLIEREAVVIVSSESHLVTDRLTDRWVTKGFKSTFPWATREIANG
jgi:hypothetical protein